MGHGQHDRLDELLDLLVEASHVVELLGGLLVEKLGLAKAGAGGDKIISFVANLASMNPDPRMKMK